MASTSARLRARIARLESQHSATAASATCPECGGTRDGSPYTGPTRFICPNPKVFGDPPEEIDHSKDFCPACGRRVMTYFQVPQPMRIGEEDEDTISRFNA